MPPPVFPLELPFDMATSYKARFNNVKFIDGGYEFRHNDGINSISHSRNVSFNFHGISNKQTLETFFENLGGEQVFTVNPFSDSTETGVTYSCKEYSFKFLGNDTYNFSAIFEQNYRYALP